MLRVEGLGFRLNVIERCTPRALTSIDSTSSGVRGQFTAVHSLGS